jgi:metacaspase-1
MPRRTALLVGINYRNTADELNGCYNDVVNVATYLRTVLGYAPAAITTLTDGNRGSVFPVSVAPTRQNIIAGLTALVAGMVPGDEAVFHYSGHGTLVLDRNGDEVSGMDSCLCPLDYNVSSAAGGGVITDDEIRALLVNRVPRGARLYVILDCCHNGTGCDIRYKYEDFSLLLRPATARTSPVWRTQQKTFVQGKYVDTAGEVYMISGCRDEQTSADAYINNAFAGALTYAIFAILRANNASIRTYSWSSLLRDLRYFMRVNKYDQIPQIMTGQLITPGAPVFPGLAAAAGAKRSVGGLLLELNPGSINTSFRGVSSTITHPPNTTLFGFTLKPKSGANTARPAIRFLH